MDFPHDFTTCLDGLTDALESPGTDLQTVLVVLIDDLTTAIPSLLGLNLTIMVAGDEITLAATVSPDPTAAATSLHIPLDLPGAANPSGVTFYASRPGAFVDLAADVRHAFGLGGRVVIDGHLQPSITPIGASRVTGLVAFSEINRAVGVLVEQGHPPATARAELHRRAERAGHALSDAAHHLLAHELPVMR